jgi:hypothetical protein
MDGMKLCPLTSTKLKKNLTALETIKAKPNLTFSLKMI